MSNNIWGYQGLQTPLENLTNGNYNVADYTAMRTEFNARILALENAGGFQPTNVTMVGYLNVIPGTGGNGSITAQGPVTFGSTLTVNSTAIFNTPVTVNGGMTVTSGLTCANANISGNLNVGGTTILSGVSITNISADSVSTDSAAVDNNLTVGGTIVGQGNISTTVGQFIGNGAGLTGVTDAGALPKAGGTMTGSLTSNSAISTSANINVTGTGKFVGDGSLLTNIPSTFTGGTLTSTLVTRDIQVQNGYAITGLGSKLSTYAVQGYSQNIGDIIVPVANTAKHNIILLAYSNQCTVQLTNLGFTSTNFPDLNRTVTIFKKSFASAPTYTVTLWLPVQSGLTWYWTTPTIDGGIGTYVMGTDVSSMTFTLYNDGNQGYVMLLSQVKV
jgi:hypothetical protein